MRIGYRGKPDRSKTINGKEYKFKADKEGRLVCEVADPVAAAIMLDDKNKNLFYPVDAPAPLQRGGGGGKKGTQGSGGDDQKVEAAKHILANDTPVVLDLLKAITDADLRAEMVKQENERAEGARPEVLAALA